MSAAPVALIAGASRGIGLAIADALAAQGHRTIRVSRSLAPRKAPDRLDVSCDITDAGQVERLRAECGAFGVPDLLVLSAGQFALANLEDTTPDVFAGQLAANLTAPFLLLRAFLPAMKARKSGRVIALGSIADSTPLAGNAGYAASKYGLRGLIGVVREECGGTGVLCTLVSPGATDTDMWDPIDPDHRPGFLPRARMLRASDVAGAITWIAGLPPHVDIDWLRMGPA